MYNERWVKVKLKVQEWSSGCYKAQWAPAIKFVHSDEIFVSMKNNIKLTFPLKCIPCSLATCSATSSPPGICTAHVWVKCPRAPTDSSNSSQFTLVRSWLQRTCSIIMRHKLSNRLLILLLCVVECLHVCSKSSEHVLISLISRFNLLLRCWRRLQIKFLLNGSAMCVRAHFDEEFLW